MKKIYYNANIVTMQESLPCAQAFMVENGRFVAVGSDSELLNISGLAERENMGGRTVVPAFFETHMHNISEGFIIRDMDHSRCRSVAGLIDYSREHLASRRVPVGSWVRGRGWNQDKFEDENRFINRYDLDRISLDIPLAFTRTCGHVIVCNSRALQLMGMSEHAEDVSGGVIDRDESGRPLGIFRENARACVLDAIPEESLESVKELILLSTQRALAHGIVEIHSDDIKDVPGNYAKLIQAYRELIEEGKLKLRIYEQCNLPGAELLQAFLADGYHTLWQDTERFTIGPYKILTDGALGARTALLREPYKDGDGVSRGVAMHSQDELNALVDMAYKGGMQIAMHAIGDAGIDMVIEAIAQARKNNPSSLGRDGIIHCQIMNPDQYESFRKMDLIAYIQPIFLNYDYRIVESRVGRNKALTSYNWKQFFDMGVRACGGSDCPVEDLNVMENIHCAVTRKSKELKPEGGWRPDQNLSVHQALSLFTTQAAYASFREDWAGSIAEGKSADFIVLSEDIFKIDPDEIKDVKVLRTYLRGKCEYEVI